MADEPVSQPETIEAALAANEAAAQAQVDTPPATPAEPTTPTEPETAEPEIQVDENRLLLDVLASRGVDFSDKYLTDDQLVKGIANLRKVIAQRDTDAEYGRYIRDHFGDLRQQPAPQPQPTQQQTQAQQQFAPSMAEVKYWESQVQKNPETGALEPVPGAQPDVVSKLMTAREKMQQVIYDLAFQPEKIIQPYLQKAQESASAEAQAAAQKVAMEQQYKTELQTWQQKNKGWLFVGGEPNAEANNFSAYGSQLAEIVQQFGPSLSAGGFSPAQALDFCVNQLRAQLPAPKPVAVPPPQAKHVPNVATMAPTPDDPRAIREDDTLASYMLRNNIEL